MNQIKKLNEKNLILFKKFNLIQIFYYLKQLVTVLLH